MCFRKIIKNSSPDPIMERILRIMSDLVLVIFDSLQVIQGIDVEDKYRVIGQDL